MVNRIAILKRLWKDVCSVYVQEEHVNLNNKRTQFTETLLFENEPCKLSFESALPSDAAGNVSSVSQKVKLFIGNNVTIPEGSKVCVTRGDKVYTYKSSGIPSVFTEHQEIALEIFDRWA